MNQQDDTRQLNRDKKIARIALVVIPLLLGLLVGVVLLAVHDRLAAMDKAISLATIRVGLNETAQNQMKVVHALNTLTVLQQESNNYQKLIYQELLKRQ